MPESKIKPKKFYISKLCRNTFLICASLLVILAFVVLRLPSDSLKNISNTKILMSQDSKMSGTAIYACDFEVFGRVQGVFFRKFTQETAKKLGIYGWCENTRQGTVRGQIEGPKQQLEEMKKWLQEKGSPNSHIDKAIFSDTVQIDEYHFKKFSIRR